MKADAIELPYQGDRISMYIVLPTDKDGIEDVENHLFKDDNIEQLFEEIDKQHKEKVTLKLPRFKLDETLELKKSFEDMNMNDMFNRGLADFSGIHEEKEKLFVSQIVQKSFVEVNEEGSEAAAATAAIMIMSRSFKIEMPPIPFICDHPFVFFIRDKQTKFVLFMGRVVNPVTPIVN